MSTGPEVRVMTEQQYGVGLELTPQQTHSFEQPDGIVWPNIDATNVMPITEDVDFAYVIRKDDRFVVEQLAGRIAQETGVPIEDVQSVLYDEYATFFSGLTDTMLKAFEHRRNGGKIQLHIFNAEGIEEKTLEKCRGPVISADPLKVSALGVDEVMVSREYLMGGTKATGIINRPGTPDLAEQLRELARRYKGVSPIFSDDDTFTGMTAAQLIGAMKNAGIDIDRAIFDIQMGRPTGLLNQNIEVDAGISYLPTDDRAIDEVSDLGDPRDFLVGASGLVVRLPTGEHGRVPYVMPFVSPSARMGIPEGDEYHFSEQVLALNYNFFRRVSEQLGHDVTLGHMDREFIIYMRSMYGIDKNTPMAQIINWAGDNMRNLRIDVEQIGTVQRELHRLNIPRRMIMINMGEEILANANEAGVARLTTMRHLLKDLDVDLGVATDQQSNVWNETAEQLDLTHSTAVVATEDGVDIRGNNRLYGEEDSQGILPKVSTKEEALALLQSCGYVVEAVHAQSLDDLVTILEEYFVNLTQHHLNKP